MTPPGESSAWAGIVGQSGAIALLRRAIAQDRVAHAYAFVGPSGVGRRLTAVAFAQAALCPAEGCGACAVCRRVAAGQHPDCQVVVPTPPRENPKGAPMIRIEQVRELERAAALAPLEAGRKVFVLDDAERMTLPTAQALLKTLEEPPPRTYLVLIIANPRALPPTLISRCQRVRFRPLGEADAARFLESRGVTPAASALLARLAQGRPGLALGADLDALRARREAALALATAPSARLGAALDASPTDRATVATYLELYWAWYRDALCLAAGGSATLLVNADQEEALRALAARVSAPALAAALARVKTAWVALESNVNPRLALETALLGLGGMAA
ncbi:MAG TPA: DNA polymerase III subunit delta' [Methylomirabilota bacterium]|jgi:DNA polymerase-3 subunit delta'